MGYEIVLIAPKTLANFLERMTPLYEQGADHRRIGKYVRNRWRWVRAGVGISVMNVFTVSHFASPPQLPNRTRDWEKLLVFFQFYTTPRNQTSAKKIIDLLIRNNIVCRPIVAGNFLKHQAAQYMDYKIRASLGNSDWVHKNGFMVGDCHLPLEKNFETLEKLLAPRSTP